MCALSLCSCRLTCWCAGLYPTCCCSHGPTCQRVSSSGKLAPATTPAYWQHSPGTTGFWGAQQICPLGAQTWIKVSISVLCVCQSIFKSWYFFILCLFSFLFSTHCRSFGVCFSKPVFCRSLSCCSENSAAADPACAQRHREQHLRGIHQITSDLLPESPGVCPSVTQPLPSFYSAARWETNPGFTWFANWYLCEKFDHSVYQDEEQCNIFSLITFFLPWGSNAAVTTGTYPRVTNWFIKNKNQNIQCKNTCISMASNLHSNVNWRQRRKTIDNYKI